jgi:hypothetical protein
VHPAKSSDVEVRGEGMAIKTMAVTLTSTPLECHKWQPFNEEAQMMEFLAAEYENEPPDDGELQQLLVSIATIICEVLAVLKA